MFWWDEGFSLDSIAMPLAAVGFCNLSANLELGGGMLCSFKCYPSKCTKKVPSLAIDLLSW
jgi:hypothetical protein